MAQKFFQRTKGCFWKLSLIALIGTSIPAGNTYAVAVNFGKLTGSFDTTVGWGMSIRTQDQGGVPASIYGRRSLFPDSGDIITHQLKASHELELRNSQWGDATFGLLIRGNYFYDFEMDNQPLPDAAENRAVKHGDITDAMAWWRFGPNKEFTLRLGKQVISWGESTFLQGNINDVNPIDFSKLRQPGSALKDAFIGVRSLFGQWQINDSLSAEAFYLFQFQEYLLDPVGNFFGTNDRIRDGGGFANTTRGFGPAIAVDSCGIETAGDCAFGPITRTGDDIPSASGQFGVSLHYFAPNFLTGMDFGFYYMRLHDRLGYLSTTVGGTPSVIATSTTPFSPRFNIEYPEDVDRFGISFNTDVKGWAVGGELSYRRNEPTQNAAALLFAPLEGTAFTGGTVSGVFGPIGTKVKGFERYKRYQFQVTTQRIFGPREWGFLKIDNMGFLGEVAYGWADDFPEDTVIAGTALGSVTQFGKFNPVSKNWSGMQIRTNQDFNRALFNVVNVRITQAFAWDIHGVSPEVSPFFREDRKRATLGARFTWLDAYSANISHTWDFGGDNTERPGAPISNGAKIFDPVGNFLRMNFSYSF
jgi:hypothetical protein